MLLTREILGVGETLVWRSKFNKRSLFGSSRFESCRGAEMHFVVQGGGRGFKSPQEIVVRCIR
jgi:hypothetical protein